MIDALVVVKVGGSLYDLPDLGERLRRWLTALPTALLFPGGGPTADVIRDYDRIHRLGAEGAHWLAIRALSLNAHFLARLLPEAKVITRLDEVERPGWVILDPLPFFQADEANCEHLPHRWDVTSDSLAVRVASAARAELVLLKSISWQGPWTEVVDSYFPTAVQRAGPSLRIRVINLRASE